MAQRTITFDAIYGYGNAPVVSQYGSPISSLLPAATTPPAAGIPAVVNGGARRDFWHSADFGLILFGLALIYFDLRVVNA
jgi:hypothetical protein